MTDICRLCLQDGIDMVVIFKYAEMDLPGRINECTQLNVKVNENLPPYICLNCLQQLNNWFLFREMCHKSHRFLLNCKQNNSINNVVPRNDSGKLMKCENSGYTNFESAKLEVQIRPKITNEEFKSEICYSDDSLNDSETCENEAVSLLNENTGSTYVCDICNFTFQALFDYLDHQISHDGEEVFKCNKCTEVFNSRNELLNHDMQHKTPCKKCNKLILPRSMKQHLKSHTDEYKCTYCDARFNNNAIRHQHVAAVHFLCRSHTCELCGKSFCSSQSLSTHQKTHSDSRRYPCKMCSYSGRTPSALYLHMSKHENGMNVCEICSKSFKSCRSLRDHVRRVHSDEKKYECAVCSKRFIEKYMLTVHLRTHTGSRPYQCSFCDKAFVRSDGLKEHMVVHGERENYSCTKCGKSFIYRRSLGRHNCCPSGN